MGVRGVSRAPRYEGFAPTSKVASETKKRVPRMGTKAERALRSALWAAGLRFRKNAGDLPGKPDVIFRKARVALFVDGDFWHGRAWSDRKRRLLAGSNAAYWVAKIEANMARDQRKTRELEALGWRVLRLWETDVLRDPTAAAAAVADVVRAGCPGALTTPSRC
jgi:DNA mismatch endonuclease, patch repair protein